MDNSSISVANVTAGYGKKKILSDVSLTVGRGEIATLIGHNGAGKTTLLRVIFGEVAPWSGSVFMGGSDVTGLTPQRRATAGMMYVPQERFIFGALTVEENLELAGNLVSEKSVVQKRREECFQYVPVLRERLGQKASTMSGGQQRLLSLAMIRIFSPSVLLLDEPSLGLAPNLVDDTAALLQSMAKETRMTVLLVEQNLRMAFGMSDRIYVLRGGKIIAEKEGGELQSTEELWELF